MKKFLSILSICCMSLVAGVLLSACGGKETYKISVVTNTDPEPYIELVLDQEGTAITKNEDGSFDVPAKSNIKVSINATRYGIDMDDLEVRIDDIEKQVVVNQNYSPLTSGETLNYGYFLISNINKDMTINVTGEKLISSTFTFEVDDIEDPEVLEKLQMTSICLEYGEMTEEGEVPEPEYVTLYDYIVENENLSFTREYSESNDIYNPYKTFRLKFDGINPFDLTQNYPFEIKTPDGQVEQIGGMTYLDDFYVVDLGDIGNSEEYTILVNFKTLNYQNFNISKPEDNMTYTITLDKEVINYSEEGIVTIQKNLDAEKADYSNMKAYVNNLELEKIAETETEESVQFKIPAGITPATTGGSLVMRINVDGIVYLVPSYLIFANSVEPMGGEQFVMPYIWAIDDEGEKIGVVGVGPNGEQLTLQGQRNAITWEYSYNEEEQAYYSYYDLYDYDIYVNTDTKILNVKEQINGATKDVSVELDNGYTFKAFYNETTKKFDSFQLEFYCTQDCIFEFKNFVMFSKNIDISYSFEDTRIENVEYAILDSEDASLATWSELDKDVSVKVAVNGGQIIAFRMTTLRDEIGAHEFKIEDTSICDSWLDSETYTANGFRYTILKFVVSKIQYDGSMAFKLVPAGTIG